MAPATAVRAFQDGVGATLGFIAVVIGLGSIFGKLLAESGAAQVVATTVVNAVGIRALPWVVAALGLVIGLPSSSASVWCCSFRSSPVSPRRPAARS
jgi:H+/gluconate symporter-like permease